jgi:xylan 1,4-beta-xylosidase
VRTTSADEPWWSRGHASVVEGPAGDFWVLYHGYENGFRTLGRQTLLEPIEWTGDGWFHAKGGTLASPLAKPLGGKAGPLQQLSDDFTRSRLGTTWGFFDPGVSYLERVRYEEGCLVLAGKGSSPADCSPLTCTVGDRSYQASVELEIIGEAQGGLALFYEPRGYVGLGFGKERMYTYNYGQEQSWMRQPVRSRTVHVKVVNRANLVTFYYSTDGHTFVQHPWQMEVSGFHHNVFGGFHGLKVALFAAGNGQVKMRNFTYRGLPSR